MGWLDIWFQAYLATSTGAQFLNPIFITGVISIISRVVLRENPAALGVFLASAVSGAWAGAHPPKENYLQCAIQALIIYAVAIYASFHSMAFLLLLGVDVWFAAGVPVSFIITLPSLLCGIQSNNQDEMYLIMYLTYVTILTGAALKIVPIIVFGAAVAPANNENQQDHGENREHERTES
jgi:hypothetical protein